MVCAQHSACPLLRRGKGRLKNSIWLSAGWLASALVAVGGARGREEAVGGAQALGVARGGCKRDFGPPGRGGIHLCGHAPDRAACSGRGCGSGGNWEVRSRQREGHRERVHRWQSPRGRHRPVAINCNPWQSMAVNGSPWQPMAINGSQWQSMATNGNQWQSMAIHGNPWQSMAVNGSQRQSTAINGNQWQSMTITSK